jgi:UDP-glucose 4-epimerase
VYGNPEQLPLAETAPTVPLNPYGQSKLEGEVELATICREGETDFAIARFANVYGPRQDTVGEGGVVSMFCEGLTRGQDLTIHGDGTQTRDFIYVGDVVSALVSMIGGDIWFCQEADVPAAGIYNVATGAATSINDLAIRLQRISGQSVEIKHDAEREGDIRDSVLSPKKAREIFEWKATSELEHSLTNTYRWFSRQG